MRTFALTLAALLLVAAPAEAKRIDQVSICGAAGRCTTLDPKHDGDLMAFAEGGEPVGAPGRAAAFYRVKLMVREPGTGIADRWTNVWVPSLHRIATRDEGGRWTWMPVLARGDAALREATRGLEPVPAARLRGWESPAAATEPGTPWGWIAGGLAATGAVAAAALSGRSRTRRTSGRRAPRPSGSRPA